jgi:hypothetical protein
VWKIRREEKGVEEKASRKRYHTLIETPRNSEKISGKEESALTLNSEQ